MGMVSRASQSPGCFGPLPSSVYRQLRVLCGSEYIHIISAELQGVFGWVGGWVGVLGGCGCVVCELLEIYFWGRFSIRTKAVGYSVLL